MINPPASPVCSLAEVEGHDPQQELEVARWRKAERERLIAARLAIPAHEREQHARAIATALDAIVADVAAPIVSLYWPFRGEPDLRPWMEDAARRGVRVALPIVVAKGQPLEFREWTPGARLERGVWNIPYPADGAPLLPTVVVAPLVGFDEEGYRLGYGGGFFDRTLAALPHKALVIGVGYGASAVKTIFPQWHDVPMDWIVTESAPARAYPPRSRG